VKVLVIGAGTMGSGIAQCFASADIDTYLYDIQSDAIQRALQNLQKIVLRQVEKGRMTSEDQIRFFQHLFPVHNLEECGEVDLVIEAVIEKMEIKKQLFQTLMQKSLGQPILASNTSSLSITELAASVVYSERVIGMHFFNPAPLMKLVEVVKGAKTSETNVEIVVELARKLGKQPVLVNEAPGFVVNRVLIPMINEAIGIYSDGVASAQDIDLAMQYGANHPMGPLALADLIGLDVVLDIMEVLQRETGDMKYRPHVLLKKMVRAGKLGRKSKEGFFIYP
jgi:3-hydroxybutyryl-CoA dehydrogenase